MRLFMLAWFGWLALAAPAMSQDLGPETRLYPACQSLERLLELVMILRDYGGVVMDDKIQVSEPECTYVLLGARDLQLAQVLRRSTIQVLSTYTMRVTVYQRLDDNRDQWFVALDWVMPDSGRAA